MKKSILAILAVPVVSLAGPAPMQKASQPPAPAPQVESKVSIYHNAKVLQNSPAVLIEQDGGHFALLGCHALESELPKNDVELAAFLQTRECKEIESQNDPAGWDGGKVQRMAYQPLSDRLVWIISSAYLTSFRGEVGTELAMSTSGSVLIHLKERESLSLSVSYNLVADGQNPDINTEKATAFRKYEGMALYPRISSQPKGWVNK